MRSNNNLIFLKPVGAALLRGWLHQDVTRYLSEKRVNVQELSVATEKDILDNRLLLQNSMIWPVGYTVSANPDSEKISEILEKLELKFIGSSSIESKLSSKLEFKKRISELDWVRTPDYLELNAEKPDVDPEFSFPYMIKTEFSCNSIGVEKVTSKLDYFDKSEFFKTEYGQNLFIEKWERFREYTVSFLPETKNRPSEVASLELESLTGTGYIDIHAKSDNGKIRISRPDSNIADILETTVRKLSSSLGLKTYFRMDFIENKDGDLFAIEINLLPYLNNLSPNRSYFPISFETNNGIRYSELIDRIIESNYQFSE